MATPSETVASIWCDVLRKPTVDEGVDFFEIGGTSLRLIRLVTRIKADLGMDISYTELMDGFTFEELILRIVGGDGAQRASPA